MSNTAGGVQSYEWHMPAAPEATFAAAVAAANSLFKVKESDDFTKTIQFVTKVSAMSWGDRCTAQVVEDGDESVVRVSVVSRNSNNTLVAGKAAKNMQAYLSGIAEHLKANRG